MSAHRRSDRRNDWWVDFRYRRRRIRKRSPVQTKRGAEQYERQLRQEFALDEAHGKDPFIDSPRLVDFAERWMRDYVEPNNRPSVQCDKRMTLRRHLLPAFGALRIDEIDTAAIDSFAAEKIRAELRPKTVNNILSILRTCLATAADWGIVRSAPRIHWRKVPEPRYRVLTETEEQALLSAVPDGFWRALIIFFLHTGVRFSEAAAVRWDDLELNRDAPIVHICRGGARGIPGDTKTGSHRTLPLTKEVIAELNRLPHLGERIFPTSSGGMMDPASKAKYLHRFSDWANVERFGWHVLRHTFATRMAAAGVPVHVLQRLLGHTSIKMTTRYVHVDQSTLLSTVDIIRRALPISGSFGRQTAMVPSHPIPNEFAASREIASIQHKTDPIGSVCAWSG